MACVAACSNGCNNHSPLSHARKGRLVELGSDTLAGMRRVDRSQDNLANALILIARKRDETDGFVVALDGDQNFLGRISLKETVEQFGLLGFASGKCHCCNLWSHDRPE